MDMTSIFSRTKLFVVSFVLSTVISTAGSAMAQQPQMDWKTLPEYMAMDRDKQRQLILDTRRALGLKIAKTDYDRAYNCVAELFNFNKEEGRQQFYNTKGLLKAAAEKGLNWKAQQIVAHTITKDFCPVDN